MSENEISYIVRGSIFTCHNELGPGLLESFYELALAKELRGRGLKVRTQVPIAATYKGEKIDAGFRMDILVEEKVIIEIKSVAEIQDVHHKQLLTYLRLANLKLGILVNFNSPNITKAIFRKVNGL